MRRQALAHRSGDDCSGGSQEHLLLMSVARAVHETIETEPALVTAAAQAVSARYTSPPTSCCRNPFLARQSEHALPRALPKLLPSGAIPGPPGRADNPPDMWPHRSSLTGRRDLVAVVTAATSAGEASCASAARLG